MLKKQNKNKQLKKSECHIFFILHKMKVLEVLQETRDFVNTPLYPAFYCAASLCSLFVFTYLI